MLPMLPMLPRFSHNLVYFYSPCLLTYLFTNLLVENRATLVTFESFRRYMVLFRVAEHVAVVALVNVSAGYRVALIAVVLPCEDGSVPLAAGFVLLVAHSLPALALVVEYLGDLAPLGVVLGTLRIDSQALFNHH